MKQQYFILSLFFYAVFNIQVHAFINIESLRKNSQSGLNTSGKVLFNQQTGNTDKVLYSAATLNSFKSDWQEYIFIGNLRYGESFDRKDTEDGNLHLRYTQKLVNNHFTELYTQYEYNQFKALTARRLLGLGYRFTGKYFNVGLGAFDENERINPGEDQTAVRGNFYLSSIYKNDTGFEFAAIAYYQPSFRYGDDTRTILNTGISQQVSKSVAMIIEFQNVYDQRPPTEIKTHDSSLMFGFNFR
jgi:hypothetical protein